jgi:hypothetical protein
MSSRYADLNTNFLNVLNNKDVSYVDNGKNDIFKASLTVEGGGVIKKGLKIGYQEKMVSGLLIYDNENFFGYSDKYGLTLLSKHNDYTELIIEKDFFEKNNIQKIAPTQTNGSKDMIKNNNNDLNKIVPIKLDIEFKDLNNFYLTIPSLYSNKQFNLNIELELSIHSECLITNLNIVLVNESNKNVSYKFINNNCYYQKGFDNIVNGNNIIKINIELIDKKYFLISNLIYST